MEEEPSGEDAAESFGEDAADADNLRLRLLLGDGGESIC